MPDKNLDDWSLVTASLSRSTKTVMVLDLVESVRLMEENEADVVHRWQGVQRMVGQLLLQHRGRLVKSLGDGMMLEFDQPQTAAQCALAVQAAMPGFNLGYEVDRHLAMRIGLHTTQVYVDELDIFGAGVNLVARLTTLAGPDEIVATAEVRDGLTDGMDGAIEDLGECYLKGIKDPVRVYRIGAIGPRPILLAETEYLHPLQPTIAVIPFAPRSNEPAFFSIGELIADGVIAQLSRTKELVVISRLSSAAFVGRELSVAHIESHLGADYVLSGSYIASGSSLTSRLLVMAELADTKSRQVVWADRFSGDVGDLLLADSKTIHTLASSVHQSILSVEVKTALSQPIPSLSSYALMLGGIKMMHLPSEREFERSRQALEALLERHRRASAAYAWIGKWYILRVVRGFSSNPEKDARLALDCAKRALDLEPESSLALAIEGHAQCQMTGDADLAQRRLNLALRIDPNQAQAWLYKSVWSQMWGSSADAVAEAVQARKLSPLDPMGYYFDMILATAYAFNSDHQLAIDLALRSLRSNRYHAPTLRALLLAQVESGRLLDAAETLSRLREQVPNLSIQSYRAMGSQESPGRQRVVAAMRQLGVAEA